MINFKNQYITCTFLFTALDLYVNNRNYPSTPFIIFWKQLIRTIISKKWVVYSNMQFVPNNFVCPVLLDVDILSVTASAFQRRLHKVYVLKAFAES